MIETIDVDPGELLLPPARRSGADPVKLSRQIAQFADRFDGMPPLFVYRCGDGRFMIFDGVTRATRSAMLQSGQTVQVQIIGDLPGRALKAQTVREALS